MENNPPAHPAGRIRSSVARFGWAGLIFATLYSCYFSHLDAVGLVGPDEPRYAWIARNMAETGDWVTPRLYGEPWFEKPPLYYWSAALSFRLFGVSETAARLPGAISALLATLALAWLAWRLYGAETARWLLLLLPTTVGMIGFSHAAATDMPFSAMLTMAMVAAAVVIGLVPSRGSESDRNGRAEQSPVPTKSRTTAAIVLGVFLGLAVLAKGPAAIILCGGAALCWALFTKRWREALGLLHPVGMAAFCLTALPWYILCAYRDPDFFRIFIIEHNFKRFLTPEFQHIQPPWYYAEIILLALLPWTGALLWTIAIGFKNAITGKLTTSACFLFCWAAFCFVFFTISRSKLPGYILPAVPAIVLIVCRGTTSLARNKRISFALASLTTSLIFAAGFVALCKDGEQILRRFAAFAALFAFLVGCLALTNFLLGVLFFFSRRTAALISAVLPILFVFPIAGLLSQFTPLSILSPRFLAQRLQAEQVPLNLLRVTGLRRADTYGLSFYLRTSIQEWDRDATHEAYVLTKGDRFCSQAPQDMICEDVWGWRDAADNFDLLHLKPKTAAKP